MSDKIFKSVFFTSLAVLGVSIVLIFSLLFNYFEAQIFSELENEAQYISYAIKENSEDFLKNFKNENKRITIILQNGKVLADTMADAESLKNHKDRKEIVEALKKGEGKSERFSETLTQKTMYYAIKLENGNILRVSTTQNSVVAVLMGLLQPIAIIIAIALIISLFLSYRVSNSIIKPINSLDLENPEKNVTYDELTPLLKKLMIQKKTINKQIEEAKKSREEFNLICENMNEGFLVLNNNLKVLSYNTSALNLLGIEDVKDDNVLSFNKTRNFREVTQKALSGERAESNALIDGKIYDLIANPVYEKGKTIGAVIVIIDITESEKREQMRREFTSNVSHELKTPLTSVSGFAEMMKSGGMNEETVIDFSNSIYTEAQRLIGLVNDIMKLSELDEGVVFQDKENVDLYELSKDIESRLKNVSEKKKVAINVFGESGVVFGVRKILDEMLYNLCDNAIKYNRENGNVDIIVENMAENVKLTVKDSGIGIPKEDRERVFERFYRVDKSRSKSAGGTGLGLAIVKHGAMYHNAKISLESAEDRGTTVTLIFEKSNQSK